VRFVSLFRLRLMRDQRWEAGLRTMPSLESQSQGEWGSRMPHVLKWPQAARVSN
jgi:hypothetical protein